MLIVEDKQFISCYIFQPIISVFYILFFISLYDNLYRQFIHQANRVLRNGRV
jgi:hypothetical protein